MKLCELNLNEKATIISIDTTENSAKRLIEIGFSAGTIVEKVITGISKKLSAYNVKNTVVALRDNTAAKINVLLTSGGNYEK